MNRLVALLILGLALGPGLQGQDEDQPANPELQRQEIVNLEVETARAIQTSSGTFFRRVYSDDFNGTLSHGQPVNKATFIEAVETPDAKYESFNASDVSVRLYRDTAIASCLWSARGVFHGQRFYSQMRALHVYVNTPRGWRAVAGQITILPPGGQQPL
jgi:Domain of unknown function (DUF4440)